MEHLAILDKKRKLLSKILSGEKTIESRWYVSQKTPYQQIFQGERIYFKNSGDPVTVAADVEKVLYFDHLDEWKIRDILREYGARIGIPVEASNKLVGKNFCTLVFLKNIALVEPFEIDKSGFGMMTAWITVEKIEKLRKSIVADINN